MFRHACNTAATLALLVALPSVVFAAAPKVTGKYAFLTNTICEAQLTVTKNMTGLVTDVVPADAGTVAIGVGYITFTPGSGTAKITGSTIIQGGTVLTNDGSDHGTPWGSGNMNTASVAYSFTSNGMTLGLATYSMVYSDPDAASGYYRSVYLVRRKTSGGGNPNCVESIWASKQPD